MKPKWNNEQIKLLFEIVEKNNRLGKPNLDSFEEYAKISNKNVLTIRNFYYSFLKILRTDRKLQSDLNIDINNHSVEVFEHFDDFQSKKIENEIENLVKQGMSVRSACLKLSHGDYKKMLRLQNKYRNIKNKKSKDIMHSKQKTNISKNLIIEMLKNEFNIKTNKSNENLQNITKNDTNLSNNDLKLSKFDKNNRAMVYKFPNQISKKEIKNKLTDEDIKSLFMGLVNLVKENAKSDNQQKYEAFLEKTQEDKRKHVLELEEKQNEIEKLNQSITELKAKNIALNKTLENYRIDFVSKIDIEKNNFDRL